MVLRRSLLTIIAALLLGACTMKNQTSEHSAAVPTPPAPTPSAHQFAYVGGGCFWCLEAVFQTEPGVVGVVSGYAGGKVDNPSYRMVCTGTTGHAEIVRIEFDPAKTTFEALLAKFFEAHDPTTLNRQGPDEGTQYRSIILFADGAQQAAAEKALAAAQKNFGGRIVTELVPLQKFYAAEDYHQNYFRQNPDQAYCRFVIAPKLKKLSEH